MKKKSMQLNSLVFSEPDMVEKKTEELFSKLISDGYILRCLKEELEDDRLSLAAKGILALVWCYSNDPTDPTDAIEKYSNNREELLNALSELEDYGYFEKDNDMRKRLNSLSSV